MIGPRPTPSRTPHHSSVPVLQAVMVLAAVLASCNLGFDQVPLQLDTAVEDATDVTMDADTDDVGDISEETDVSDPDANDVIDATEVSDATDISEDDMEMIPPPDESPRGFGALTTGGEGGEVILVTSLADSGDGTLREALLTAGPRRIEFDVEGVIDLKSPITVTDGNVTVDGSTAPGAGVVIANAVLDFRESNVVLRYLRFRGTYMTANEAASDNIRVRAPFNGFLIDHCSFYWATDEPIGPANGTDLFENATIQWSIMSSSLASCTDETCIGGGMVVSGPAQRVSIHHNLFAHNLTQSPGFHLEQNQVEVVSNVIYHYALGGTLRPDGQQQSVDFVGNRFIRPAENSDTSEIGSYGTNGALTSVYVQGNIGPSRPDGSLPETAILDDMLSTSAVDSPFVANRNVPVEDQTLMPDRVLDYVGATLPCRDTLDAATVAEVRAGTGDFVTGIPSDGLQPPQCASP